MCLISEIKLHTLRKLLSWIMGEILKVINKIPLLGRQICLCVVRQGSAMARAVVCGHFSLQTGFEPRLLHVRFVWSMWHKEKCFV